MIDFLVKENLEKLNNYLEDKSYAEGFRLSPIDIKLFQLLKEPEKSLPHLHRWFKHIKSYENEFSKYNVKDCDINKYQFIFASSNGLSDKPNTEDDIDLFASDEEDEEAEKLKQERLAMYAEKKAKKTPIIAKSSIVLDVKPWDSETDMLEVEKMVKSIEKDGLLWGKSQLVPLAYGIKKLQITCVVEDDKVGTDILEEEIMKFEDLVQSVDVAAFNKI